MSSTSILWQANLFTCKQDKITDPVCTLPDTVCILIITLNFHKAPMRFLHHFSKVISTLLITLSFITKSVPLCQFFCQHPQLCMLSLQLPGNMHKVGPVSAKLLYTCPFICSHWDSHHPASAEPPAPSTTPCCLSLGSSSFHSPQMLNFTLSWKLLFKVLDSSVLFHRKHRNSNKMEQLHQLPYTQTLKGVSMHTDPIISFLKTLAVQVKCCVPHAFDFISACLPPVKLCSQSSQPINILNL